MPTLASLGQLRIRAIGLLAAVFLAGALAGAGVIRYFEPRPPPPPPGPGLGPFSQLGLTPDQQARAREIIEKHRGELDAIVKETMPRVRAVQETIDREMLTVLTPDQLERFRALRPPPPMPGMGPPPGPPGPPAPGPGGPPPPGF